jgi:antitoxin VapB
MKITNPEADRLVRQFAQLEGVGLTEAVLIAMKEALAVRGSKELASETAETTGPRSGLPSPS